jgi:hypothetical protein
MDQHDHKLKIKKISLALLIKGFNVNIEGQILILK